MTPEEQGRLTRELATVRQQIRELRKMVRTLWRAIYGGSVPPPPRPSAESSGAIDVAAEIAIRRVESRELEQLREGSTWTRRRIVEVAIGLLVAAITFLVGFWVANGGHGVQHP